jgi:hypothetical protein
MGQMFVWALGHALLLFLNRFEFYQRITTAKTQALLIGFPSHAQCGASDRQLLWLRLELLFRTTVDGIFAREPFATIDTIIQPQIIHASTADRLI